MGSKYGLSTPKSKTSSMAKMKDKSNAPIKSKVGKKSDCGPNGSYDTSPSGYKGK